MPASWTPLPDDSGVPEPDAAFPSPFDELAPAPVARRAAEILQAELRSGAFAPALVSDELDRPGSGKMFGVLVARAPDGGLGFLRAFSGTIAGRFDVPGFVPPLFDREARARVEVPGERVVTKLAERARAFASSADVAAARGDAIALARRHSRERDDLRERHRENRERRRVARKAMAGSDPAGAGRELDQQSRGDKAERRALDARHAEEREVVQSRLRRVERRLAAHARLCGMVSRRLMREIHDTYLVGNARGERRGLRELWSPDEPPGGAGDCAAPKLLAYAFANGFRPVALAEFWWGAAPAAGGRVSGAFYPACRDKCGPLLPFLLDGLDVAAPRRFSPPSSDAFELPVVHEDAAMLVVDKPAGLLSVPARDPRCRDSALARLLERYGEVHVVHRLDLDTSGLLVFARDAATQVALQRQFLRRTVEKRYVAILEGTPRDAEPDACGTIELAIRVDPNDRPRQVHDPVHGRAAVTDWRILGVATAPRGSFRARVALSPRTGRTHQLRVHCAHPLGLDCPIVGDRLYGRGGDRLHLHAERLAFLHPNTGEAVTFVSPVPF